MDSGMDSIDSTEPAAQYHNRGKQKGNFSRNGRCNSVIAGIPLRVCQALLVVYSDSPIEEMGSAIMIGFGGKNKIWPRAVRFRTRMWDCLLQGAHLVISSLRPHM
jgi:hypothetical protein